MFDHRTVKLGKRPPRIDARTLRLARYITKLAPAPPVFDQSTRATNFGMMLNDQLGDCTIAAVGHMQQIWTSQTSAEVTAPDALIETAYEAIGGYKPGDPTTDQGCVMLDVLRYWKKNGMFGRGLSAYVSVDTTKRQEVMDAIYYFGGLYVGLALPLSAQSQAEWVKVLGPSGAPGSWGGHCVAVPAYSFARALPGESIPRTLTCITWGERLPMTWQFFANYCDEAYALFSLDWLMAGKSPQGFDSATLLHDLAALRTA